MRRRGEDKGTRAGMRGGGRRGMYIFIKGCVCVCVCVSECVFLWVDVDVCILVFFRGKRDESVNIREGACVWMCECNLGLFVAYGMCTNRGRCR